MKIGEVCFETNDVVRLANFYKWLLNVPDGNGDEIHQTVIAEETMLTVFNDGSLKRNDNRNISVAFTVRDINAYYNRLVERGVRVIQGPTARPWGTVNMSFYDPDNNVIYLREFR